MVRLKIALVAVLIASPAAAQQCGTLTTCPQVSTPLAGSELLYVVQGGVSKKMTASTLGGAISPFIALVPGMPISPSTNGGLLWDNNGVLADSLAPLQTALPSLTTSQLYGGTGRAGVAQHFPAGAGVEAALGNTAGASGGLATYNQLGTAAFDNTGTSGATIPLNNSGFTQSGPVNFTGTFDIGGNLMTFPGTSATLVSQAGLNTAIPSLTTSQLYGGTGGAGVAQHFPAGAGVEAALQTAIGSAGAPVVNGGALGTPSSGVATNLTGTASGLTVGNAATAATVTTNANLTGPVSSVGNATTLLGTYYISGLTCNGSTDNSTVLNAAFTAAGNNTVIEFPAGLSGCIADNIAVANNNVVIDFNNTELETKTGSVSRLITFSGSHQSVYNPRFNGNSVNIENVGVTGSYINLYNPKSYSSTGFGILILGASNSGVYGCEVYSNTSSGIATSGGTAITISHCPHIQANGGEGITLDNATTESTVVGNILVGNGTVGCFGGIGAGNNSNYNTVIGNVITGTVTCGGIGFDGKNNVISGNVTNGNNGPGILIQYNSTYTTTENTVTGNNISEAAAITTQAGTLYTYIGPNTIHACDASPMNCSAISDSGTGTIYSQAANGDTTSASARAAPYIGQVISATAAGVTPSGNTEVASLSIPAGHWQCEGWVFTHPAGTTTQSVVETSISTSSAAPGTGPAQAQINSAQLAGDSVGLSAGPLYLNLTTATTYYSQAYITYAVSTLTVDGGIQCLRIW